MSKQLSLLRERGFTLVELMVVVAIIGILSAVAVPNFKKYQAKSKTSEAKLQLSAAYTAEQSFYSDFDSYHVCLRFMGYNPTNEAAQRYYAVGFGSDFTNCTTCTTVASLNGAVVASTACASASAAGETIFAATKLQGTIAAQVATFTVTNYGTTAAAAITADSFVIGAVGIIDNNFSTTASASAFSINETKRILQVRAGY